MTRVLCVSNLLPNLCGPQASAWVLLRAVGPLAHSRRLVMPEEDFSKVLGLLRLTLDKKIISKYLKLLEICAPAHWTGASRAQRSVPGTAGQSTTLGICDTSWVVLENFTK